MLSIGTCHNGCRAFFCYSFCRRHDDAFAHFYLFDQREPGLVLEHSEEELVGRNSGSLWRQEDSVAGEDSIQTIGVRDVFFNLIPFHLDGLKWVAVAEIHS